MTGKRLTTGFLILGVIAAVVCGALAGLGVFAAATDYRPVPAGHQEIVFLAPATSADSWERLLAAVDALHEESSKPGRAGPKLHISKENAFTALTADVPEVSLWLDGHADARLWIRWYKISAEFSPEKWIARLTQRSTPPLAVVGGDTSHRALLMAQALQQHRRDWQGPPPLFFITTATVDRYVPNDIPNVATTDEKWPKLIDVYEGRSFRFSFTNSRMTSAVLDFVRTHGELWPHCAAPVDVAISWAAANVGAADPLAAGVQADLGSELLTTYLYTVKWDDDSFSADLADRFQYVFLQTFGRGKVSPNQIEYSVGDFFQPNPREAFVVGQLIPELKATRERRQLLLLPATAERARRFLRSVVRRSAAEHLKNLVVMTGDSLGFNTIYRDRAVGWNIQDLPVTLVLFSHRNPIAEDAGFNETSAGGRTGTEELLLYRDILEALLLTAYQEGKLTSSSDDVASGFLQLGWSSGRIRLLAKSDNSLRLFNPQSGDRNDGSGEHIIVLRPDDAGALAQASITIWHLEGDSAQRSGWREVRTLQVKYDALTPDSSWP